MIHEQDGRVSMVRHRFLANANDPRPITFPPPGPYWVTGRSFVPDERATVLAYLPEGVPVEKYWPEAVMVESRVAEMEFTDRFVEPEWWAAAAGLSGPRRGEQERGGVMREVEEELGRILRECRDAGWAWETAVRQITERFDVTERRVISDAQLGMLVADAVAGGSYSDMGMRMFNALKMSELTIVRDDDEDAE